MKIKEGFMLREIAGSWVVVPLGKRLVEFNSLMMLSESGALLWRKLEQGADMNELTNALLSEYEVDEATAQADIEGFISNVQEKGLLV